MLAPRNSHHIFEHQVSFAGIYQPVSVYNNNVSLGTEAYFRLTTRQYLTSAVQIMNSVSNLHDFFDANVMELNLGAAVGYVYKTPMGPFRAELGWSTLTQRLGVSIGIGLTF